MNAAIAAAGLQNQRHRRLGLDPPLLRRAATVIERRRAFYDEYLEPEILFGVFGVSGSEL